MFQFVDHRFYLNREQSLRFVIAALLPMRLITLLPGRPGALVELN